MKPCRSGTRPAPGTAKGAALLAFMLALIAGSSWLLLSDINGRAQTYVRRIDSGLALNQAKSALLSYAMNYPDLRANPEKGPGFLPCPDRNNDGRPESNCALSTGTTLGRLPFAILGLDDPRDSSGERLWYALSPDFRNTRSNQTLLNSATPGQLSVDGVGDVVAVVMAPGAPIGVQTARPSNNAADYLEGENADIADGGFSRAAGNDLLVSISRAELMAVAERRVAHEARAALARYRAEHGAYPWLTPFADPSFDGRALRGRHSGGDDANFLMDKRNNFGVWKVAVDDIVRNLTDGSAALVSEVSKHRLKLTGHAGGAENDFDKGDAYVIEARNLVHALSGTARAGSRGLVLKDRRRNFVRLGIAPGDIVENLSDGSSGAITDVTRTTLTARALTGGVNNSFDVGDSYRLRGNAGVAASGSAGLTLVDAQADFSARGVGIGDMVENLSDGSVGRINKVDGATTLTVSGLEFGETNTFRENDVYRLPRYNAGNGVRKGLLAVHEPGKRFPGGFSAEWQVVDGWTITGLAPDTHPRYAAAVSRSLRSSAATGAINVAAEDGHCVWVNVRVVECAGVSAPTPLLEGRAGAGSTASTLTDSTVDFTAAGIKPGDLIERPHTAVVTQVVSSKTLNLMRFPPASQPPVEGEHYRIRSATRSLAGIAAASGADRLQDPDQDFGATGITAGDVVENITDGSFGLIADVGGSDINASLHGGRSNVFRTGDEYRVYYGYANRRRYRFNLFYQGSLVVRSVAGARRRDVCLGYGDDCAALSGRSEEIASGNGIRIGKPLITIEDLRDDAPVTEIGLTAAPDGVRGAIRVRGIDYYLSEAFAELPRWFIRNRWHQLIYIAYSAGFVPGGGNDCRAGTDCLTVQGRIDDGEASVVSAGMSLAQQDRSSGAVADYYENENAAPSDNDIFSVGAVEATFNDQVVVVAP